MEFCLKRLRDLAQRHRSTDLYGLALEAEQIRLQEQLFELEAKIAGYDLHISWDTDARAYRLSGVVGVG